jgi:hypothetical protein
VAIFDKNFTWASIGEASPGEPAMKTNEIINQVAVGVHRNICALIVTVLIGAGAQAFAESNSHMASKACEQKGAEALVAGSKQTSACHRKWTYLNSAA